MPKEGRLCMSVQNLRDDLLMHSSRVRGELGRIPPHFSLDVVIEQNGLSFSNYELNTHREAGTRTAVAGERERSRACQQQHLS